MTPFADDIRAGKINEVIEVLEDVEDKLLNNVFEITVDFNTVEYISIGPTEQDSPYEIPRKQYEKVGLLLTPFHLAIISRRVEMVQLFLEKIVETKDEKPELLLQVLECKVGINYNDHQINMFDKDSRSLDGMNSIHLAARFDHYSMNEITRAMKLHMTPETILNLIQQPTNHLLISPLHLAVQRSLTFSTR